MNYYLYVLIDKVSNIFYLYNTNNKIHKYESDNLNELHQFGNNIDKIKLTNNNNDFLIIKDNYVNITSLSTFINYQLNLKLTSNYNGNYPTNIETLNIYDSINTKQHIILILPF